MLTNIIEKNIDELIPYAKNPRKIEDAIPKVKKSIQRFGFKNPLVIDKNGVIVCGHTRVAACKALREKYGDKIPMYDMNGKKTGKTIDVSVLPCVLADDLTDEQINAFRLADNRVAEYSEWDYEMLDEEIEKLGVDLSELGFDSIKEEIEEMEEEMEVEKKVKGDEPFTEYIDETSQYVVLTFRSVSDWQNVCNILDLPKVKSWSTSKKKDAGIQRGIGRVIDGNTAFAKIRENIEKMG